MSRLRLTHFRGRRFCFIFATLFLAVIILSLTNYPLSHISEISDSMVRQYKSRGIQGDDGNLNFLNG